MQSCSVHHCVLLLLTLTFTTAPVAAAVLPIQAKLHQRVTLPCAHECSGEAKWTLYDTRSVFARCDQTSCSSVVKGYEMSHDQYLKGDLSLTITAAEYSMRDTYACECRSNDYAVWRLSIETVFSAVQVKHDGDLILDLTVPEPVEVIYTSSDSAAGERICNVTQRSLQCKAEYTHRTSLRYPELTLRDVTYSDSGRYTIRDTKNKEDIRVYAVAVTGLTKGMTAGIVVLVLLLVLGIIGVMMYKWREVDKKRRAAEEKLRAAEEKCRAAEKDLRAAEEDLRAAKEECRAAEEKCRAAEEKCRAAEEKLRAAKEKLRAAKEKLRAAKEKLRAAKEDLGAAEEELGANKERRKVENEEQAVYGQMNQLLNLLQYENQRRKDQFNPHTKQMETILKNPEELGSVMEELEEMLEEVEKMINDLEERYRENREYKYHVESFCYKKRSDLDVCRNFYKTIQTGSRLPYSVQVYRLPDSLQVYRLTDSRQLMKMMMMMERVLGNLEILRRSESLQSRSFLYTHVDSGLNEIKSWCEKTRDDLKCCKEEPGDAENVKLMIDDTEALLSALGKWCDDEEEELQQYKPKPVSAERSENQPSESEPLYRNV